MIFEGRRDSRSYFHETLKGPTYGILYTRINALGALYVAPGALQAITKQSCLRYFTNDGTYAYVHRGEAPKSLAAASGSAHPLLLLLVLQRC